MSIAPRMNDNTELKRLMKEAGEKIEEQGGLLSADEIGRLQSLEAVIEKGRQTFIDVGMALTEIKEKRLWKGYGSFKGYLENRWNFSRQFAYMQIEAYEAAKDVSTVVDTPNEKTAREFVSVPRDERPKVAEVAKEVAKEKGRETINSRDVKDAKAKVYKVETKIEELPRDADAEPVPTEPEPPTLVDVDDDEEWLKSLPIHAALQGVAKRRFEEAALTWKQFEAPFKSLAMQVRSAHKDTPSQFKSRFHTRQLSSFVIDAPQHWQVCRECGGTGQIPKIGQCGSCSSDGFQIGSYKK